MDILLVILLLLVIATAALLYRMARREMRRSPHQNDFQRRFLGAARQRAQMQTFYVMVSAGTTQQFRSDLE